MTDKKYRHPERSVESDIFNLSRVDEAEESQIENEPSTILHNNLLGIYCKDHSNKDSSPSIVSRRGL